MFHSYLYSPIGLLDIVTNDHALVEINIVSEKDSLSHINDISELVKKQLQEYFNNERKEFNVPLELKVKGFEYKVLQSLLKIKFGETISYQQLGKLAGYEKAARAVGNAIHKNPIPIIIPCHRVIKSDGSIGGFGLGIENKKILLNIEKTQL